MVGRQLVKQQLSSSLSQQPALWREQLNDQQRAAVESKQPHLAIVAGPGTGKTFTLAARVAFCLQELGLAPQEVCAITFTHKAAAELRQRVSQLLGEKKELPFIGTFHSLAYQQLRQQQPQLHLLTAQAQRQLLKQLLSARSGQSISLKAAEQALSLYRSQALPLDSLPLKFQDLLKTYREALQAKQAIDFDGLLEQWLELLQQQATTPFKQLLVDEFQDSNALQLKIIALLCQKSGNLTVIGDPRQAIYGFRGASSQSFVWLKEQFPGLLQLNLQSNYRSAPEILQTAQRLFPQDVPLLPLLAKSGQVQLIETVDEYSEAELIVGEIENLVGGTDLLQSAQTHTTSKLNFADMAVLYRSKGLAQPLIQLLALKGIPYRVVGEESMFSHSSCLLTVLGLYQHLGGDPNQLLANQPELEQQVDKQVLATLTSTSADSLLNLAQALAGQSGWLALLEKKRILQNQWQQWLNALSRFKLPQDKQAVCSYLAQQLLYQEAEVQADRVTLLTMHAAKGLEFAQVFILACEDGCIPHAKAADLAEEERLLYVALTRAKQRLLLSFAQRRNGRPVRRSAFIAKILAKSLVISPDPAMPALLRKRAKYRAKKNQPQLF